MLCRLGHAMVTPASRGGSQLGTTQRSHPAMSFIALPAGHKNNRGLADRPALTVRLYGGGSSCTALCRPPQGTAVLYCTPYGHVVALFDACDL